MLPSRVICLPGNHHAAPTHPTNGLIRRTVGERILKWLYTIPEDVTQTNPWWLFPFKNCLWDFKTCEFREADPAEMIHKAIDSLSRRFGYIDPSQGCDGDLFRLVLAKSD
eukprot:SAG22_NODE_473_length_10069_cov_17.183250_8_plen_110_part_00